MTKHFERIDPETTEKYMRSATELNAGSRQLLTREMLEMLSGGDGTTSLSFKCWKCGGPLYCVTDENGKKSIFCKKCGTLCS